MHEAAARQTGSRDAAVRAASLALMAEGGDPWDHMRAAIAAFDETRAHLANQNARTEADRAVLDAMGEIDLGVLEAIRDKQSCAPPIFHPPCLAELARRGLKPVMIHTSQRASYPLRAAPLVGELVGAYR